MASYPDLQLFIAGMKRADGQPVLNPADESVLASSRTGQADSTPP
jgi:hypothetical protein